MKNRFSYYGQIKDPIRSVLKLLCGGSEPPPYVQGYDYDNLTDDQHSQLQDWVGMHISEEIIWSTAIGIIDAAENIVAEAVANANILPEETK